MSPSNQNLNYNQQQQIHRTAGLQRLTADLAGLQFNDAEALFKNYANQQQQLQQQQRPGGGCGSSGGSSGAARAAAAQINKSPLSTTGRGTGRRSPVHPADHADAQAQQQLAQAKEAQQLAATAAGYDEQMVLPAPGLAAAAAATAALGAGSQFSDYDPAKDAQETAEDAAQMKRYKIVQLIGTGNYARVYKAVTHSGRELAIKVINLIKTSDNYKQKFLPRELAILKRVSHVNICKTYEINHINDRVFIVMQFCTNGTIADLLHRIGPISEPVARHLFAPVVDAVAYLHSVEFAHRDLKVENILLDADYNPKLTDFSYSINTNPSSLNLEIKHSTNIAHNNRSKVSNQSLKHAHQQLTATSAVAAPGTTNKHQVGVGSPSRGGITNVKLNDTFCGTLPYLSPEMIRQYPYDAKKTDVWSLGICLYVMLNDRLPFPFNDVRLMIKKQMTKEFKFKTNLEFSEQIRDLMNQILEPDFSRRPNCHEIARHQWFSGPRERPT